MDNTSESEQYEGWAIIEIMGRRRIIGYVTRQTMFGRDFMRVDLPTDPPATQFYGGDSVYCLTPTTEQFARNVAKLNRIMPVQRWELPPAKPVTNESGDDPVEADIVDDEDGQDEGDGYEHPF